MTMSHIWLNTLTWWGGLGPGPLRPPESGAGPDSHWKRCQVICQCRWLQYVWTSSWLLKESQSCSLQSRSVHMHWCI